MRRYDRETHRNNYSTRLMMLSENKIEGDAGVELELDALCLSLLR
jgi:hypothetical protein